MRTSRVLTDLKIKILRYKQSTTFIAADPPMPPTGGGTRTFHFVKAVLGITDCSLFVLFPVKKEELPGNILGSWKEICCSKIPFSGKSKGRFSQLKNDLRLLLAPWSIPKEQVILTTGYFVTNPYTGKNVVRKAFLFFLRRILLSYVVHIYRNGFSLPAKTLERLAQFNELESSIANSINISDILWIDFSSLLPLFPKIKKRNPAARMICNAHNIEYKLLERLETRSKNDLERKWYNNQAAIMKKTELKGFADCDLIITCSEEEKLEILNHLPNANVEVIPNGVDINYFVPHSHPVSEPTLLFTGTMGYAPNREAVDYFLEKIFPLVVESHPTCTFVIAGANAGEVFAKYKSRKNIEIISSPEDIRPVYDKAWIVVVPLLSGSGTRLKILEAMAMEKPVVSTPAGAKGLKVTDNVHLLIAEDEKEFAERITTLIERKELRDRLTSSAKESVSQLYNWEAIEQKTHDAILELA